MHTGGLPAAAYNLFSNQLSAEENMRAPAMASPYAGLTSERKRLVRCAGSSKSLAPSGMHFDLCGWFGKLTRYFRCGLDAEC
jgi:predicted membrane metal-binding protein